MVEMKWQNPPSRSTLGALYDEMIAELTTNPGEWALIKEDWKTSAPPAAFQKAGCETTTRANKDTSPKTWSLYARYPLARQRAADPVPADVDKAKVRQAVRTGTALTPPPPAAPRRQPPAPAPAAPACGPANDFGMAKFRADRLARGVPPEGQ